MKLPIQDRSRTFLTVEYLINVLGPAQKCLSEWQFFVLTQCRATAGLVLLGPHRLTGCRQAADVVIMITVSGPSAT